MRRILVFVVTISLLGQFSSLYPALAQSSSVTNEQMIQHVGDGIFRQTELALTNELQAINSRRNSPQYQTELQTNAAERSAFIQARTAFENYLISHENETAEQRYSSAIRAASVALTQAQQGSPLLQSGLGGNFINQFKNQLELEAGKTEWIRAITTGQALSVESQQAANATQAAANPSKPTATDKCTFFSWTISGCIDEGVTWLIKSTILQIAGFLVWLTANMLNYAIQISVLDFAKWAPDSLYPIWIVVRQIVSLAVVFAGLYLGFMYIIGREQTFTRYVGWLVIFALFVNFSYPITRALVDVSNIISLNVYTASVGPEPLANNTTSTAGGLIMAKLGLHGLVSSATTMAGEQADFIKNINSIPGALLAVAFVLYAAWVFFVATAIIAIRAAILVFLIVASPLLLIDSVVPKLGDVAMKMRKLFFEQLAVAPVFMIMLALTLKFMDVFSASGALNTSQGMASLQNAGQGTVQTFFSILMMLIMLHITLRVTRDVSGAAGKFATDAMGKVGGFGLGLASGGAGLLARGTIGAGAARLRDSGWMDKMQGSRMGRGLYGLSNSLAQSTFDTRNIGMVSSTMQKAGLTSIGGIGMQRGLQMGADKRFAQKQEEVDRKAASIKDDAARTAYRKQSTSVLNRGLVSAVDPAILKAKEEEAEKSIKEKRDAQTLAFTSADPEKRKSLMNQATIARDDELLKSLRAAEGYLAIKNDPNNPDTAVEKAKMLKAMKFRSDKAAEEFLRKNDPFKDINDRAEDDIKAIQDEARKLNKNDPAQKARYNDLQARIGKVQNARDQMMEKVKKDTWFAYSGGGPKAQQQSGPGPSGPTIGAQQSPSRGPSGAPTAQAAASAPLITKNADGTHSFNGSTFPDFQSAAAAKRQYRQAPYNEAMKPVTVQEPKMTIETPEQAEARVQAQKTSNSSTATA